MNNNHSCDEIWAVATRKDLAETGGSHNEKGKEFQRHWAVMRMFEIEEKGTEDFLFLFESIQDIAEFDSATNPSSVQIYQVKKKDRKEWTWNDLTGLTAPSCPFGKVDTVGELQVKQFQRLPNWNSENTSSAHCHGGSDQPRTGLRLACRDWSGTNEALGVCSRDATINRLIVDSVDHGVRQQYLARRRDTAGWPKGAFYTLSMRT
jgi:hypothetical protein